MADHDDDMPEAGGDEAGAAAEREAGPTTAGFVALMLAYLGSRFVIEVVLHRT